MQIAVRSYLTMGTAAVVGAGAIALAPLPGVPAGPAAIPAPAVVDVALTGLNLPISQIIGVLENFGIGGSLTQIFDLLPASLVDVVGNDFFANAGGLVVTAATDLFGFLNTTIAGLITGPNSIVNQFGTMLGAVPGLLSTAVQSITTGDFAGAIQAVTDAFTAPLTRVAEAIADAGAAISAFVVEKIGSLANTLPNLLLNAVQSVLGGGVQAVFDTVKKVISGVTGLFGGALPFASAAAVAAPAAALTAVRSTEVAPQPAAEVPAVASVASSPAASPRANRTGSSRAAVAAAPAASSVAEAAAQDVAPEAPAAVAAVSRQDEQPAQAGADTGAGTHAKSAHSRAKRAG